MALTLASAITAASRTIEVEGTVPASIVFGYRFRLDDELLEISGFGSAPLELPNASTTQVDRNKWRVRRGLDNAPAASHAEDTEVLGVSDAFVAGDDEDAPSPFTSGSPGGSALTVADEGTPLDTAVTVINYTGPGVTASVVGHAVTVEVKSPPLVQAEGDPRGVCAVHFLEVEGDPDGGSFKLTFRGDETAAIAWNATAQDVEDTLNALPSIDGEVQLRGSGTLPADVITYVFVGDLGHQPVELATVTDNSLTGGTAPNVSVGDDVLGILPYPDPIEALPYWDTLTDWYWRYVNGGWHPISSDGYVIGWDNSGLVRATLRVLDDGTVEGQSWDDAGVLVSSFRINNEGIVFAGPSVSLDAGGTTGDAGQVLTADGLGTATWEDATGGGLPDLSGLSLIADPTTATPESNAIAFNALLTALGVT